MSQVNLYNKDGKASGHKVNLPPVFATPLRPDLIRKAVRVARANRRQRYGAMPVAGERASVEWPGKGKGMARTPRRKQGSGAAFVPNAYHGRRAHPPESRHFWTLSMNRKERQLAIASALAATADPVAVKARGHRFTEGLALPLVVSDDFATSEKTSAFIDALAALGVAGDLDRAKEGTHIRAGMGKLRGRARRTPRSFLLVTADGQAPAARNLPGVEVVSARNLGAEDLAPGGDHGRLTLYTQGALAALKEAYA